VSLACEVSGSLRELAAYRPRRPQDTALHRVLSAHLETYLERRRGDPEAEPLPDHVEQTLRSYLRCGIPAFGVARARCSACGLDVLVPFSCKKRGVCPSCEARHRVETAAHLVDHVIPRVPVRHWVLSLPKRVRYFCKHRPVAASAVLRIFLRAVQTELRRCCPDAPGSARFGAVGFEHRAGAFLNDNYHWHVEVTDGVFADDGCGGAEFFEAHDLSPERVLRIEAAIRRRVIRWLVRHGMLEQHSADEMLSWEHRGGFSLDASTRIEAWDRHGLERLSRYCARPALSLQRLHLIDDRTLLYRFQRPDPQGRTEMLLTPLQLIDRLVALIPPPYRNRVRYFGVLGPAARLRKSVVATAGPSAALQAQLEHAAQQMGLDAPDNGEPEISEAAREAEGAPETPEPPPRRPSLAAYCWAMLLARIYEVLPLLCPRCGQPMKIIAFVTERESLRPLLECVGQDADPPPLSPARGPPQPWLELGPGAPCIGEEDPPSLRFGVTDQTLGLVDEQDTDQSAGLPDDHVA